MLGATQLELTPEPLRSPLRISPGMADAGETGLERATPRRSCAQDAQRRQPLRIFGRQS